MSTPSLSRTLCSALFALGLGVSASGQAAVISTFSGGDVGEGLDLDGDFTYAVNVLGGTVGQIRDAVFLSEAESTGATVAALNTVPNWFQGNYGDSVNDNRLEGVMRDIRWTSFGQTPRTVNIDMNNLVVGESYKLQMLFTESCCDRAFGIEAEGDLIVDDFSINGVMGINQFANIGVVVTHEFTAIDSTLNIVLDGIHGTRPDRNPHISGFTLERLGSIQNNVPLPATTALLGLGLLALRRKRH